jgi:signal transduction histidine kinase
MSVATGLRCRFVRLAGGRRLPRRTVRVRLTLLYGGLFLVAGVALVVTTYVLFERATESARPALPRIPHAPTIRRLRLVPPLALALPTMAQALPQLAYVQSQIAVDRNKLRFVPSAATARKPQALVTGPGARALPQLAQDQHQLARGQHQLARAVSELAGAVHQMARARSAQAAQRAADSHQLLVSSGIALGIVTVLAIAAGWLVAGRILRPIRTITRTAQRISSASLDERLALDGPQDELKALGDTLDDLFGRLGAAFAAQRQFVANASHELRAPLTRQRALIQVALADPQADGASLRATHERVLASEQDLEQIIDGLLALTRGQAGLERREPLDLAALAARALLGREAQLAGLDVHRALAPAPMSGDSRLLERLLANLVDNAIRHNTSAGNVEVSTGTRDGHAFLTVANSGPIVPPGEIERLLRPFQRLAGARTAQGSGHGLGLSIVEAIAAAHHAELDPRPRPGGGLTVEVSFPR